MQANIEIYQKRVAGLQELLRENNVSAALIMYPRDLFYYSGTAQPSNLWIPSHGDPVLFTRRAHDMTKRVTWISQIIQANSFKEMLSVLDELKMTPEKGGKIGIQQDVLPTNIGLSLLKNLKDYSLMNVSKLISQKRLVKDPVEINNIRLSIDLWKEGHKAVLNSIEEGITEYELAANMEFAARKKGGDGVVWFRRWDGCLPGGGIVTSGPNAWEVSGHAMTVTGVGISESLPWGASKRKVKKGDLIVVDYGVCREGYHADMARTYCVGKPNEKQRDLWNRLVELHLQVIEQIKPGVTGEELYLYSEKLAKKEGLDENFMGVGNNRGQYIGHSIGLEIDEEPVLGIGYKQPLPAGAIVTIEPKFMVPGLGSVMVEDDILITNTGNEILSTLDRELFYID
ncbi:Xaa-Pro peptidase family protein [Neobacillus mesonae]|uniref:M24 family metallopeptidase n=1 Tax=Neobacillus mesonae TaxID=1193713 RepID=UPI00203BA90B|nr:Xaa-Pro peptidase family protein [Neobacillus mesonae]MCM3566940.1 Xaa-Pro peptidase family protein [Neobacillus mesonae]